MERLMQEAEWHSSLEAGTSGCCRCLWRFPCSVAEAVATATAQSNSVNRKARRVGVWRIVIGSTYSYPASTQSAAKATPPRNNVNENVRFSRQPLARWTVVSNS